ncbi:MAG: hypothetical protein AAFY59_20290, partial [Pseudomonadota bacterium]
MTALSEQEVGDVDVSGGVVDGDRAAAAYGITNPADVTAAISAQGANAVVDLTALGGSGSITVNNAAG